MKLTPAFLGESVKKARKAMGVTQKVLALTSGTGLRFIIDLEKGKPTCQIGKVLTVLQTLGIKLTLVSPAISRDFWQGADTDNRTKKNNTKSIG